ncbi:glycosyltransferase family 4 protein [Microbacterium sp. Mu-80]|uniref:D-inositol 3-phosphate glycosyltransferase n=1 Tax=Microbacterium bandirmense TaxID=3122050 RepID=A0ABU8LD35_9MICO
MTREADRPRRVALVTSSFAPHVGGVEEHVAQVARGLAAAGHTVEVWAVDRGDRPAEPFGHGVVVRYLPTPLPARSLGSMARFVTRAPAAWRAWTQAHRSLKPDVVHVHCFGPNGLYALALHRRYRTPLVITSHGETTGDDTSVFARSALLRDGLRRSLAAAAAVTAPTDYVLTDLRKNFGLSGGEVVANGVDLHVATGPTPISGRYILAVRRLGWMKGVDLLIDAFAVGRVRGTIAADVRLVIAGDGPERERLEEQIFAAGLLDDVTMLGWQDAEQVASLTAGAEAMVVPSRDEAFGIVALEAWRDAAPLIMTTRGGAREFTTDGVDAVLVDPEDTDALASTLARVLSDDTLRSRLTSAGLTRVREFSWGAVTQKYLDVYQRVLKRR